MNTKQLGILLVLAAVLTGAGWWWSARNTAGWSGSGRGAGAELLGKFELNDVAQMVIRHGTNEVTLVKATDRWQVRERAGFPAAFADFKALLLKLAGQKIVQSDDVGASQLPRLQLAGPEAGTNAATVIELRGADNRLIRSLLLGKKHLQKSPGGEGEGWPDGRYVMTDAASGKVFVISDALNEAEPQPANWLDKDFVRVDKALSLAVTFPTATNSWQLTRTNDTADWQLADAGATEKLDASKLSDLTTPLSSLTLADVAVPPVALTNPVTIAAKTADGFSYMFQVGAKSGDNYPVTFTVDAVLATNRPAGDTLAAKLAHESSLTNWSYLVAAYALDSVLKPRSDWLVAATNAPAK